jgi:hypothetical protein
MSFCISEDVPSPVLWYRMSQPERCTGRLPNVQPWHIAGSGQIDHVAGEQTKPECLAGEDEAVPYSVEDVEPSDGLPRPVGPKRRNFGLHVNPVAHRKEAVGRDDAAKRERACRKSGVESGDARQTRFPCP